MDAETKYVVCVAEIEPLLVALLVVDYADSSHMVHNLTTLQIEQVVTAVKASIPGM